MKIFSLLLFFTFTCAFFCEAQNPKLIKDIVGTQGIVALWDFKEPAGQARIAKGAESFPLKEGAGAVLRAKEGPLSGYSASFDGATSYLSLASKDCGTLNIKKGAVTVIAWVKWSGKSNSFIGGAWNEYADGGRRQYGLFISLPFYNGADKVCGHISKTGKSTPPFQYSIDYCASVQTVPSEVWCAVAMTYDGKFIKSYLNGEFLASAPELISYTKCKEYPQGVTHSKNPYYFPDGLGFDLGSDFTVGAVLLKNSMGNYFKGLIGGLAVFERALSDNEIKALCAR